MVVAEQIMSWKGGWSLGCLGTGKGQWLSGCLQGVWGAKRMAATREWPKEEMLGRNRVWGETWESICEALKDEQVLRFATGTL